MARAHPPPSREGKLSAVQGAGYGVGETGLTAAEFFLQVVLLQFYVEVVGLSAPLAGALLATAVVWDAVSDPLMGALSDRVRSRWGRRRPFILLGGLALAAAFVALFNPPPLGSPLAKAAYLLLGYLAVNTSMTVIAVPHAAFGADLASTDRARTALYGWRFAFANLGMIVAIVAPGVVAAGSTAAAAAPMASRIIAIVLVVAAALTLISTSGRDRPPQAVPSRAPSISGEMIAVLRNRRFAWLLGAFVVGSLGRALNAALALFFYQHRLALEPQTVFLKVLLPFTFVIAVSILAWAKLSQRVGFVTAAFWGILGLGVMTSIAYPLFPEGAVGPPLAAAIVGGILVGAVFLLDATVATIATSDDGRREGLYFGFWRMGGKLARALGLALTGVLLHWIGFVEGAAAQSASTRGGLALLFGPGVGLCFIAAALIVRRVRTTTTSAPVKDGKPVVDGAEVATI